MKLIKSKKASENYLSKIVKIDTFRKHNDPEVQRLKCCTVDDSISSLELIMKEVDKCIDWNSEEL